MYSLYKRRWFAAILLLLSLSAKVQAEAYISDEHLDVNIVHNQTEQTLSVNLIIDGPPGQPVSVSEIILGVTDLSLVSFDSGLADAFPWAGDAGDAFYVLPSVDIAGELYLGIAAYDTASGDFVNNLVAMDFVEFTGPGDFFLNVGDNEPKVDSRPGATAEQTFTLGTGGHEHMSWWFSEPGIYQIGVQARGTLQATNETLSSPLVNLQFLVDPTPIDFWKISTFGFANAAEGIDLSEVGAGGLPRLLAYAFDIEPESGGPGKLPFQEMVQLNGETHLSLVKRRPMDRGDLTYTIQGSTNLTSWQDLSEHTHYSVTAISNDNDGTPRNRITLNNPLDERYFLRVKVSFER